MTILPPHVKKHLSIFRAKVKIRFFVKGLETALCGFLFLQIKKKKILEKIASSIVSTVTIENKHWEKLPD